MKWINNKRREKIYIVDTTSIPIGVVCATTKDDKLFVHSFKESNFDNFSGTNFDSALLASFLNQLKIGNNSKVIFLWNGLSAATFTADVSLKKQHSEIPLNEVDVHRIFETATFQFFTQFREEAKKRFKVDDLGVILANNRILDFKLDGETYINMESVKAKRADVSIEQTFLRRELHEAISDEVNSSCNVLHVEIGTALSALAKISGIATEDSLIIHVGHSKSHLYLVNSKNSHLSQKLNSSLQYSGEVDLGVKNIYESLFNKIGIGTPGIEIFIDKILKESASTKLVFGVKKAILGSCLKLVNESKSKVVGVNKIVLFMPEPLATFMEQNDFAKNLSCIIFSSLNKSDILHQEISISRKLSPKALSPAYFAGLIAYWSRLGDNNEGVRRRGNVGWLISHNSI